jgi:hypothetical protein
MWNSGNQEYEKGAKMTSSAGYSREAGAFTAFFSHDLYFCLSPS